MSTAKATARFFPALGEAGLKDHTYWGILLLVTLLHGPGKISLDHFIRRKWMW